MLSVSVNYLEAFKAPARQITGSVICETANGSLEIKSDGSLINFKIEKTAPQGKLFGFTVSQKITIEAIGALSTIQKGDRLIPSIKSKDYTAENVDLPYFYVDTVDINKVKNTTIIIGYDILHKLDTVSIGSLEFTYPINAKEYANTILTEIGANLTFTGLNQEISAEPNLNGNESARDVLAALAEFTGSICYVQQKDAVYIKGMTPTGSVRVIGPDCYFDLTVGETITISRVASGTELGDNASYGSDGYTQIMWENPFLTMREDIDSLLMAIGRQVIGVSSAAYTLNWRGCPAYEIGDYLILDDKEYNSNYVRYFNETIEFNGGLTSMSEFVAIESESIDLGANTVANKLKVTSAKVDKVNQEIELVAKNVDGIVEEQASIKLTTENIVSSVELLGQTTDNNTKQIENLSTKLEQTAEDLRLEIRQEIDDGTPNKVTTTTGFTFNDEGLTISKSNSEMSTQITEDGLTIYRGEEEMLIADNEGVYAANLNATTFFIMGDNSRFEDYQNRQRTGCFWIGGV